MAPEVVAQARADYSSPIDIFSFGIILWQLLTCALPYRQPGEVINRYLLLHKIVKEGLRPEVPAWFPAPLAALVRECWAEAEHTRPTAAELVLRLQDLDGAVPHPDAHAAERHVILSAGELPGATPAPEPSAPPRGRTGSEDGRACSPTQALPLPAVARSRSLPEASPVRSPQAVWDAAKC